MRMYVKSSLWDCILCIIASAALSYTACSAFYSTQPYQDLQGTIAIVGVCAVVTVALFAVVWNTTTTIFGGIALAVVLIGAIVASFVTSTTAGVLDDEAGNNLYLALCVLLPPVIVFVLSRWRVSAIVLIVLGVLLCAVIEYLYWYGHVIAALLFLVGGVGLFIYRTYQKSLVNSESETLAFGSVTGAGVALALVSLLLGAGFFLLVLAPFNPPNLVIKLLTEHYRTEEIEVKGTGTVMNVQDNELFSNVMSDQTVETSTINNNLANRQNNESTDQNNENAQ